MPIKMRGAIKLLINVRSSLRESDGSPEDGIDKNHSFFWDGRLMPQLSLRVYYSSTAGFLEKPCWENSTEMMRKQQKMDGRNFRAIPVLKELL